MPGRFNLTERNGVEVILDYGHNRDAMLALAQACQALGRRRTVVVFTLPGDRRDEDLVATLAATTPFAHEYVLYETVDRRGRRAYEIPEFLSRHLPPGIPHELADDLRHGIRRGWSRVAPGDLLVIIAGVVEDAFEGLRELEESMPGEAACLSPISAGMVGR